MLSYRFMSMRMSGSRIGHDTVDNARVLAAFPVTPTEMITQMHMLGLMIAPSDHVTFMAMLPIIRKDMDHRTRTGLTFQTHSEGIGDLRFAGLIPVLKEEHHSIHLNVGISAPTGEIDEHADLPTGPRQRLPYPMQLGSGTWDLLPGVTYNGKAEDWSWGAQVMATIRPGRNRIGYALGNQYELNLWGQRKWTDWFSNGIGFRYKIWSNITSQDSSLTKTLVPTADPKSRGGKRLDVIASINLLGTQTGFLKGHRLALEVGVPFMQSLDGPQLETDWHYTVAWQKAFG